MHEPLPSSNSEDEVTLSGPVEKPYCTDWLINLGWLNTALAVGITKLPVQFLLKDGLHLTPEGLARFMLIANIPIYLKPLVGILSDALPMFGTRRRSYLLLGLVMGSACWFLLGLLPLNINLFLITYFGFSIFSTVTSTVLGGLMVEVGKRENITGRLSAQRHGINQLVGTVSGLVGGPLAKLPFLVPASLCAVLYIAIAPLYWLRLLEPRSNQRNTEALPELWRQCKVLAGSRILWSAAGLVILVVAAPGFNTPLFYIQTNVLKFKPEFIGLLETVGALCGMGAAYLYTRFCRQFHLRKLLAVSIVVHAALTLLYLLYKSPTSALIISGIEQMTMVFALLPLYDLAARATPKGSEALGYSLMMSVWNFTTQFSNLVGAWMYDHWGLTFSHLVWVNSGTTILVLLAVPFLPSILVDRRDGDGSAAH